MAHDYIVQRSKGLVCYRVCVSDSETLVYIADLALSSIRLISATASAWMQRQTGWADILQMSETSIRPCLKLIVRGVTPTSPYFLWSLQAGCHKTR